MTPCKKWRHRLRLQFDRFGNLVATCKRCGRMWVS